MRPLKEIVGGEDRIDVESPLFVFIGSWTLTAFIVQYAKPRRVQQQLSCSTAPLRSSVALCVYSAERPVFDPFLFSPTLPRIITTSLASLQGEGR